VRYCKHCGRMVQGHKRLGVLSWLLIVVLSGATLGVFLLLWIPWVLFVKKRACPICGAKDLLKSPPPPATATS
jgi:hypothetical protein